MTLKRVVLYLLIFWLLLSFSYYGVTTPNTLSDFFAIYLYFGFCSTIIIFGFYLLSKSTRWKSQLGFIYLPTIFLKLGGFALLYAGFLMTADELSKTQVLQILVPIFLGLFFEVFVLSKILQENEKN